MQKRPIARSQNKIIYEIKIIFKTTTILRR